MKQRVDAKEKQVFAPNVQGPVRPQDIANVRQAEARRQGELYGNEYGKKESGGEVFGRQATNTLALGLPQLAEAYMPSWLGGQSAMPGAEAHEFIKASDAARGQQNRVADIAGTGAGIVGQIAAMPASAPSIGGRLLGAAGGRVAGSAALGAGLGGTEAAITSRGDVGDTARGVAGGLVGGAAGGVLGEAVGSALGNRAARRQTAALAPSREALDQMARQSYQAADNAGVWFSPPAYGSLVNDIRQAVSQGGFDHGLHPAVQRVITRMEEEGGNAVTLGQLDRLRRVAGSAARSSVPDEGRLGSMIIDHIDDFIDRAGPQSVIFGRGQEGAQALQQARAAYAARSRADRIERAFQQADDNAGVAGSGANIDNTIRQAARRLLNNRNDIRGFSEAEVAALREVARGTLTRNALRYVGKAAPTGIVSGALSAGTGGAALGPVGAVALPLVGYAAKAAADRATRASLERVSAMTRSRINPGAAGQVAQARLRGNQSAPRLLMTLLGINVGEGASTLANQ